MPARIFANYLKVAIQNFPQSVFDYPNMNGEVPLSPITIEDVDEVVDESEEKMADKKVQTEAQKQVVEETKKQEVKKQEKPKQKEVTQPKKAFEVNRADLIEYDDEKVNNSAVPLPGM